MKVLLVFAHPEPRSLNGALRDVAIKELEAQGHEVRVSDLYAERWKSEVDRSDFPTLSPVTRLKPAAASKMAFEADALTEDAKAEIGETAVGRCPDPSVSALVVQHAGDPQGLDRSGVFL